MSEQPPSQNVDIVRRAFEAFNSEDIERILALTHVDFAAVVSPELSPEPDTYRGHEGMRRYFQSFQDVMDEIRFRPQRFWEVGPSVVVSLTLSARGRRTAIPVTQRLAQVWTIRDGRALRVETYASPAEALEAVGRSR
jgi:ketosteroid isomerase-like protein